MIKRNLKPKKNTAKRLVVETGFLALARGLQSASHFEEDVQKDLEQWAEGYSFCMSVLPNGPVMSMEKRNGKMIYTGRNKNTDLVIELKNLETAFQMITTQAGIPQVYAAHGIGVVGDTAKAMSLIRMINVVEAYLFPEFLSKNILKKVPPMNLKRHLNRAHMLTVGMILGK